MKYYYNAQITEFEWEGETDHNIEIPDFDEEFPVFENFGEQVLAEFINLSKKVLKNNLH